MTLTQKLNINDEEDSLDDLVFLRCSVLPIGACVQEIGYEHVVRH